MRHLKAGRKFDRNASSRRAMFRNLAANLITHERIETTDAKAKELRRVAERLITKATRLGKVGYTPQGEGMWRTWHGVVALVGGAACFSSDRYEAVAASHAAQNALRQHRHRNHGPRPRRLTGTTPMTTGTAPRRKSAKATRRFTDSKKPPIW